MKNRDQSSNEFKITLKIKVQKGKKDLNILKNNWLIQSVYNNFAKIKS